MNVENRQKIIGKMFDRIAPRYDFLNALLSGRQDRRWRKTLLAHVPHVPSGRLLDVATGTGDVLLGAAPAHPEYSDFVGIDISGGMLEFARAKSRRLGVGDRCRFEVMDAAKIVFPDRFFDCVTIAFGLRNVVERKAALSEFFRVMKPGGTLLVMDFFVPREGWLASLFLFYFKRVLPLIGGLFSDRSAYAYLPSSVDGFASPRELALEMQSVGLMVEDETRFLWGACRLIRASRK